MPRWPDVLIFIGRGNGKNGYLSFEDFCLLSPVNGIREYDIDICANSEDQAKTTFKDIYNILENPKWNKKFRKNFSWNLTQITNKKTNSTLRFRTNSPKSKDGMRSGKVDFDEIHAYENWDNINVFTTGFGKKPHPRQTMITTNGEVREGPLDSLLKKSKAILNGEREDNGLLPFLCMLDKESEVHKQENWPKANPSIIYLPHLMAEVKKEYVDFKEDPIEHAQFMSKRMNMPERRKDTEVASWDDILKTNREIPNLAGKDCVAGIDFAKTTDFIAVDLLFREGDTRYVIHHSWMCANCNDKERIKFPLATAERLGLLTVVNDVEIHPKLIAEYISKMGMIYNINKIAIDSYRYSLLSAELKKIGFDAADKMVKLVRPSDIMRIQPTITSWFVGGRLVYGDDMMMRWYTNNSKLVPAPNGNFKYGKIEPKSRKTDGFMAFVAAATIEEELPEEGQFTFISPIIF